MPNDVSPTWHDPFWSADPKRARIVRRWERRTGSIVDAFNTLWGLALDARDNGMADYLAMQHDDIEPESWWVNTFIDEMRTRNAAVISAHVACRDHKRGRVSTAIGIESDSWDGAKCLTFDDLAKLPKTFGPKQACKPGQVLLINTGLMVIDLRRPEWDEWIWPQDCRFKRHEGRRVNQLRTEDWEFSRFMHSRGIRYLCTSKIETRHWGLDYWSSKPESIYRPRPEDVEADG